MADAGSNYYNALSGFGNDMAAAMYKYHQEHQAYDQQLGVADALSRIGVDPSGKIVPIVPGQDGKVDKSIKPVLDPKAVDMFRSANRRDWAKSAGALEALGRLGMQFMNKVGEHNLEPSYDVTTPSGRVVQATGGQAITTDLEQQRRQDQIASGQVREARAQRQEQRADRTQNREDVRLGMSAQNAMRQEIEKRPEIQFSRKYGFTPQSVIGLQESKYVAKDAAGQQLGVTDPLPPGQSAATFPTAPPWWKELITLGFAKPDPTNPQSVRWEPQNADGQVFRESRFEYSPSAKTGTPKRERFVPDPEGQFLNLHGTRIPIDQVSAVQNAATSAQKDLANTLASPRFQQLPPDQQAAKLLQIKDRLSTLGYDPNSAFWGLPQQ